MISTRCSLVPCNMGVIREVASSASTHVLPPFGSSLGLTILSLLILIVSGRGIDLRFVSKQPCGIQGENKLVVSFGLPNKGLVQDSSR